MSLAERTPQDGAYADRQPESGAYESETVRDFPSSGGFPPPVFFTSDTLCIDLHARYYFLFHATYVSN